MLSSEKTPRNRRSDSTSPRCALTNAHVPRSGALPGSGLGPRTARDTGRERVGDSSVTNADDCAGLHHGDI